MSEAQITAINSIITAPSLYEEENVSGVSSVVSEIFSLFNSQEVNYTHLRVGAKDKDKKLMTRAFNSAESAKNLGRLLPSNDILHLNTAMNPKSIIRDYILGAYCYRKKPIVLHIHGGKYIDRIPNFLIRTLIRRLMHFSDRIILLSERERQIFTSVYGLDLQDRISVLPNFVAPLDVDRLSSRSANRNNTNQKLKVVFVGRLEHEKGLVTIVDAFSKLPQLCGAVELDVYGSGSLGDWFCGKMGELLSDNFRYHGVRPRSEIRPLLSQYDLIVLPSLFGEGLPMALLEGMAAGCVPFASALASVPMVVQPDVTGILLQPGSADDLADKLIWAIGNRDQLVRLSDNAANYVRNAYSPLDYKRSLLAIYQRALEASSTRYGSPRSHQPLQCGAR
jgi:glycosyltransferase involved in cell wall biosynthesis